MLPLLFYRASFSGSSSLVFSCATLHTLFRADVRLKPLERKMLELFVFPTARVRSFFSILEFCFKVEYDLFTTTGLISFETWLRDFIPMWFIFPLIERFDFLQTDFPISLTRLHVKSQITWYVPYKISNGAEAIVNRGVYLTMGETLILAHNFAFNDQSN